MFYTRPWKHDVIDNFFDEPTHEYCIEYLQSFRKRQNTHTVVKDKKLLSYFDNIFTEEYLKTNFPQHRPYKYLESVAEVNICTDEFYYGLHDEAIYKIFSVVVYLAPRYSNGTFLFNSSQELKKQIVWKPNRAFAFAGKDGVTWHSYGHWDKATRVTINYFKKFYEK
tara:strand:- start:353 stop:853 length:501 start_codon:yes stop_codon:yes gene_type:complete